MKQYKYIINDNEYVVDVGERKGDTTFVCVNGETYNVTVIPEPKPQKKTVPPPPAPQKKSEGENDLQDALRSPLPGTIVEITTSVGTDVKEGDTLVVLEAMKMNNNLTAERDGIVKAILVKEGEAVKENTPLITFE